MRPQGVCDANCTGPSTQFVSIPQVYLSSIGETAMRKIRRDQTQTQTKTQTQTQTKT